MPKVFISYRRDDSAYPAQNIYDKLAEHYGSESVVFDVDTIPKGVDFVDYLNQQVSECNVLLAVIGHSWLDVRATDGSRRIDNPEDFVRIEIQAALQRDIPVIPVFVDNARMPRADELPLELKPLSRRNAAEVRAGRDFQTHLERLVRDIERSLQHASRSSASKTSPTPISRAASKSTLPPKAADSDIITNSIGMKLKLLPPGTFLMGTKGSKKVEIQHEVTLTKPFWLGIYPVTQAEYRRVMRANPSEFKLPMNPQTRDDHRCDPRPVERVSWFDAIDFCSCLSDQEGLPRYYDVQNQEVTILGGVGYRLPTEAEWEYACRAGSQGKYCFGDDENQLRQYARIHTLGTSAVGKKLPNDWGLFDMHGNVSEWCWDWYDEYPSSPVENPTGPSKSEERVHRGGSWGCTNGFSRSASRGKSDPEYRNGGLGFRVATALSGKTSR